MKGYFKYVLIVFSLLSLDNSPAKAQLITNLGDTITILKGGLLFIGGDFSLQDSGTNHPVVYNKGTIKITGDLIAGKSTIYSGTRDSLILSGTGNQNFAGLSYGSLIVTGGATKYPLSNPFIVNAIVTTNGIIDTKSDTITLDSTAFMKENPASYVIGNIVTTRHLMANTNYTNGNIGMEITTGSVAPGITRIFRKNGSAATQNGFCSKGIERYYKITPANNYNLGADLVLSYLPWELNGIIQSDLGIFRSDDNGINWIDEGYTFRNASQFNISINGMDTLSRYTIGSTSNPIRNAMKAGINQTICSNQAIKLGGSPVSGHIYNWTSTPAGFTPSLSSPVIRPKVNTTYYLTETVNTTACLHKDSVTINVNPVADSTWTVVNKGGVYTFKANDTSEMSYKWYFGDGDSSANYKAAHVYKKTGVYKVRLVVINSTGCSSEFDSAMTFQSTIHTANFQSPNITIFPNPFSGKTSIRIKLNNRSNITVILTDIMGKTISIIANGTFPAGEVQFELIAEQYHLRPGIYLLKTNIDNDESISRIIKL
jgi:PKD repeat protein